MARLDEEANEVIKKANRINSKAEKLRQQAKSSYKNCNIDIPANHSSELGEECIEFDLTLKNGQKARVIYDTLNDEVETISGEEIGIYSYDLETGKLSKYTSADNKESMEFSHDKIEGCSTTSYKETKFNISYNYLGEINWASIENSFYDNESDPQHENPIMHEKNSKSAINPEHDGSVCYALYEEYSYPSVPNSKKSFFKWITYRDK